MGSENMQISPLHLTHVLIAFIYAIAVISITALEVLYIKPFILSEFLFLTIQNIGIMGTSGYFASKIQLTKEGFSEINKV